MAEQIRKENTLREILAKFPQTRSVFNNHGLLGCGGPLGPVESLAYFATAHNVNLDGLLAELNACIDSSTPTTHHEESAHHADECCTPPPPDNPDTAYRKFLRTAVIFALSIGCGFGALLLATKASYRMGWITTSMASWWTSHVQIHGYAQLFGWVGLFIMGVAYHVVPRFNGTTIKRKSLATVSFWLMVAAILLKIYFQPLAENDWAAHMVIWASGLGVAAVILYMIVLGDVNGSRTKSPQSHDGFLAWGTRWFFISSLVTFALSIYMLVEKRNNVPMLLDDAYLHVVLVGFIMLYILGVSMRTLPLFLGVNTLNPLVAKASLLGLNCGVVLYAGGTLGEVKWLPATALVIEAIAILSYIVALGVLWKKREGTPVSIGPHHFEKFIRTAYGWLVFAVLFVAGVAIYSLVSDDVAPQAYLGAYRHVLTIGFITMMIMGMAFKMIPVFEGRDLHSDRVVDVVFWLVNIGAVLRVGFQIAAEHGGKPFAVPMGISGFIELTAIALFGWNIWKTMSAQEVAPVVAPQGDGAIDGEMTVGSVVEKYPQTLEVFLAKGFGHLRNPVFRNTVAKTVPIKMACGMHHINLQELLADLNAVVRGGAPAEGAKKG